MTAPINCDLHCLTDRICVMLNFCFALCNVTNFTLSFIPCQLCFLSQCCWTRNFVQIEKGSSYLVWSSECSIEPDLIQGEKYIRILYLADCQENLNWNTTKYFCFLLRCCVSLVVCSPDLLFVQGQSKAGKLMCQAQRSAVVMFLKHV